MPAQHEPSVQPVVPSGWHIVVETQRAFSQRVPLWQVCVDRVGRPAIVSQRTIALPSHAGGTEGSHAPASVSLGCAHGTLPASNSLASCAHVLDPKHATCAAVVRVAHVCAHGSPIGGAPHSCKRAAHTLAHGTIGAGVPASGVPDGEGGEHPASIAVISASESSKASRFIAADYGWQRCERRSHLAHISALETARGGLDAPVQPRRVRGPSARVPRSTASSPSDRRNPP